MHIICAQRTGQHGQNMLGAPTSSIARKVRVVISLIVFYQVFWNADDFLITAKDTWSYMEHLQSIYTIKEPAHPEGVVYRPAKSGLDN